MLLIGSRALVANNPELEGIRRTVDWDFICTIDQFSTWHKANKNTLQFAVPTQGGKYYHARDKDGMNYEFELAWPGTSAEMLLNIHGGAGVANNEWLLLIKESHKYKKNSVHFLKTMRDIKFLREKVGTYLPFPQAWGVNSPYHEVFKLRESESYTYAHPKLNVSSKEFFSGDNVNYIYSHDSLHEVVALDGRPAYKSYMKDGSEVMTSKEKFFSCSKRVQLLGGVEEAMVLCAERSLISHNFEPDPDYMFEFALQKLCTSISSGWFRESCWEGYYEILDIYKNECKDTWVVKLREALSEGRVARHGE